MPDDVGPWNASDRAIRRAEKPMPAQLRAALELAYPRSALAAQVPNLAVLLGVALIPVEFVVMQTHWWLPVAVCLLLVLVIVIASAFKREKAEQVARDLADGRYVEWNGPMYVACEIGEGQRLYIEAARRQFSLSLDATELRQLADDLGGRRAPISTWNSLIVPGAFRASCVGVLVYLEHAGLLLEARTKDHSVVYRDPRFAHVLEREPLD